MQALFQFLLEQGLSGVIIIGLGWHILQQNKEIKSVRDENKELQKETNAHVNGLHEKRIDDMQRTNTVLNDHDKTLAALVASVTSMLDTLKNRG